MISRSVPAGGVHVLDGTRALALWNWLLRRQGLADGFQLATPEDIARACLGLHAARLPSPYATVLARIDDPGKAAGLFDRTSAALVTVRCMYYSRGFTVDY